MNTPPNTPPTPTTRSSPPPSTSASPAQASTAGNDPAHLPVIRAARTIQALTLPPFVGKAYENVAVPELLAMLQSVFDANDARPLTSMLTVHAHVLDSVFNHLLTSPSGYESRSLQFALALRAQKQCMDTLATLHELTRPQTTNKPTGDQ